jgi:hypothetical protein
VNAKLDEAYESLKVCCHVLRLLQLCWGCLIELTTYSPFICTIGFNLCEYLAGNARCQ